MGLVQQQVPTCDVCLAFGVESLASWSGRLVMGDALPVWLDLCAQHEDAYLGPARHAAVFARPDGHECALCGRQYRYRASLRNHTREKHSTTLAEVERRFGRTLPRGATGFACEQGGCPYVALAPAGLATHRRSEHGITADEFWQGDPTRRHGKRSEG